LTPDARIFYNRHAGETALIVCNGPSLFELPLEFLNRFASFGCNTLVTQDAFRPSYYVAVDGRVRREFGDLIEDKYADIPKFFPVPQMDTWEAPEIYHWFHRPGKLWEEHPPGKFPWGPGVLMRPGITWHCCPHAMMQIAAFMGFRQLLVVGMDHSANRKIHAWGEDKGMTGPTDSGPYWSWLERGHQELAEGLGKLGVKIVNVTPNTCERALPKGDWRDWMK